MNRVRQGDEWNSSQHRRVLNEFWAQGDREREMGIAVGPLNDRTSAQISKGQVGFIGVLVAPLFEELKRVLPAVTECCARRCRRKCSSSSQNDEVLATFLFSDEILTNYYQKI